MYVNDWTLDFGPRGRQAVTQFLAEGHKAGVLPETRCAGICEVEEIENCKMKIAKCKFRRRNLKFAICNLHFQFLCFSCSRCVLVNHDR